MHTLSSTHWRLWLDPAQGVSWQGLEARHDDQWMHVMPDCRNSDTPGPATGLLAASSFVMLPYSNRIRDGRFSFADKSVQLEEADTHAIHGALRKQSWEITHASDTRLTCRFDSRAHAAAGLPPINWPWPIDATIDHVLKGRRLISELSLTNRGQNPMPAGLGWHPYFLREINGSSPKLTVPVSGVFPDTNGDCLPVGSAAPLPAHLDFRTEQSLLPDQPIDNCFSGLDGNIRIRWPKPTKGSVLGLTMRTSPICRFAVLYNPDKPFFAVEPVSNANDAFNLDTRGIDAGLHVLEKNGTLRATMMLDLDS